MPRMMTNEAEVLAVVAERIRHYRLEAGYANTQLAARAIGIPEEDVKSWSSNLSAIERGRHLPRLPLLLQLADAFGVTVSHLAGDISDDKSWTTGYRAALTDVQIKISELRKEQER